MPRSRLLLYCGVVSSVLYVVTDIVGGTRYDGYRFTSQAVSELMAVGAPSERLVDPLFLAYDLLVIAFGLGVVRAAGHKLAVRLTGYLLVGYGVVGLTGPTLFEMHPRGTSDIRGDLPHLVVTGVIALLTLAAIGIAAFAFDPPFRRFSFITLATMTVAGFVAGGYGTRLAANEPTPGFGIVERIDIYASLVWIAVFALVVRRQPMPIRTPNGTPHP